MSKAKSTIKKNNFDINHVNHGISEAHPKSVQRKPFFYVRLKAETVQGECYLFSKAFYFKNTVPGSRRRAQCEAREWRDERLFLPDVVRYRKRHYKNRTNNGGRMMYGNQKSTTCPGLFGVCVSSHKDKNKVERLYVVGVVRPTYNGEKKVYYRGLITYGLLNALREVTRSVYEEAGAEVPSDDKIKSAARHVRKLYRQGRWPNYHGPL